MMHGIVAGQMAAGGGGGSPYFANMVLGLHMDGTDGSTTFTDQSSTGHTVTANGSAAVDTAQSQFGGASALFTASTSDYLDVAGHADFSLTDFNVECWVRFSGAPDTRAIIDIGGAVSGISLRASTGSPNLALYYKNTNLITYSVGWTTNTWYHVGCSRESGTVRLFKDGTILGSTGSLNWTFDATPAVRIGHVLEGGANAAEKWIDDLTIHNVAIRTANFTPPAAPFEDS